MNEPEDDQVTRPAPAGKTSLDPETRWSAWRSALTASWPRRLQWRGESVGATLRDCLETELAERAGFQWLAVAFAAGSLGYFMLPREPLLLPLLALAAVAATIAAIAYQRGRGWRFATVAAVLLAGAMAAKVRVDSLTGPEITRPVYAELTGRVIDRESRSGRRPRIVLDRLQASAEYLQPLPAKVRVTVVGKYGLPPLGARVSVHAQLAPISGAVVPGGYDAHRAAFFEGIGGSGYALGKWQAVEPPTTSVALATAEIRAAIVERIVAAEPGEAGAVAAALLVGERGGLSEETNETLRLSGLYHIISISGLHMMLIAGTVFFIVRALLALSPRLALERPIRKWAAATALFVVTCYFVLSGGGAATVRSYVMAAIIFAAMLIDRAAISMRNLAVAAFIVLLLEPESVAEPGFQMSFAAVTALIAAWELWRDRPKRRLVDRDRTSPASRLARFLGSALFGVIATTTVAGAATAPYAAYFFERITPYSLLGNLLAAPLVSVIIMPFGLLALVAMPFGLEALPLSVMARGIDMLLRVSAWVAELPGADTPAPRISALALLVITAGLLWLCLWRLRWRLLGAPIIGVGLALIPLLARAPDIIVTPDGDAAAVRDASGLLRVSGARAGSYVVDQFFDEEAGREPDRAALGEGVRCDKTACLLTASGGVVVSHVLDPAAFAEDCARADVIVTSYMAPADCAAALVVDSRRLAKFGAHSIGIADGEATAFAVTTEYPGARRPWQSTEGLDRSP